MHAPRLLILTLGSLLLAGCATSSQQAALPPDDAWLSRSSDCCAGLAHLPATPLAARQKTQLVFGPDTPVHGFDSGKSPFQALALPRQAGPLKLSFTSEVLRDEQGGLSLFAPTVLLLNEQGSVQRRFGWRDFNYRPARGLNTDRLVLSFGVTPGGDADRVVVMTTNQALDNHTQLLHPARAYARARNQAEPNVKNPIAAHRASGRVELEVIPLGEADGLLAPLIGGREDTPLIAPETEPAQPAMPMSAMGDFDYRRMIRAALEAEDIALAMELAERAERSGDIGARAWLAEQLRTKGQY